MLREALFYADVAGFACLPVGDDCRPGRLAWEGTESGFVGVHDATRNSELLAAYWARYPTANLSVACGAPSGVFVLDVDVKGGFDGVADLNALEERHGPLPPTWRTRTPSGGLHLWFEQPERELTNRVHMRVPDGRGGELKTGLDVRTTGGCVPIPPSAKPAGSYAWEISPLDGDYAAPAPAWLLDIIDPPLPSRPPAAPISVSKVDRTARYIGAALDNEASAVARMGPASGRNLRLFQAAANLGELVGALLLPQDMAEAHLERAAQENGLWREDGARAVMATIRSGLRKGMAHPREVIP